MRIDPGQAGAVPGGRSSAAGSAKPSAAVPAAQSGRKGGADETAELRQAAQEFESFLLQQLLKQARASARLLGGDTQPEMAGRDIFESWQDESYANAVSSAGGLGLADMLVRQLQLPPPRPIPAVEATPESAPGASPVVPPAVPAPDEKE